MTTPSPAAPPEQEVPSLADVIDALNVFNPGEIIGPDGEREPWTADDDIGVRWLPAFVHSVGRAWYAPSRALAPAPEQEAPLRDWAKIEAFVEEYIDDYELRADAGCYRPDESERVLLRDSIAGLLADDEFLALLNCGRPSLDQLRQRMRDENATWKALGGDVYVDAPCDRPPAGWTCSRGKGHEGPCAASLKGTRPLTALRAVIAHWDEFGPEHGFDEIVDCARRALAASPRPLTERAGDESHTERYRREAEAHARPWTPAPRPLTEPDPTPAINRAWENGFAQGRLAQKIEHDIAHLGDPETAPLPLAESRAAVSEPTERGKFETAMRAQGWPERMFGDALDVHQRNIRDAAYTGWCAKRSQEAVDAARYRWLLDALDSESVTEALHEAFQNGPAALSAHIDAARATLEASKGSEVVAAPDPVVEALRSMDTEP